MTPIQAAKAGILEIADVFVVNKSDRPGAQEVIRDLRTMLAMAGYGPQDWKPPIVSYDGVQRRRHRRPCRGHHKHRDWLAGAGQLDGRRRARAREEISAIALAGLRQRMGGLPGESRLDELAGRVAAGDLDPYTAADELISG